MNRSRWLLAAVVVVALISMGWWWRARSATKAPRYRTGQVDRGHLDANVSATGTVQPVVQVEVGSQVSGVIQKLAVDYNARVRRGDLLCQLDPASFHARVVQSEAAVARADASVKDAGRILKRASELLSQDYIAQADVDAAQATLDQRLADLKQAHAQLEVAQLDLANTTITAPIDGVVISRSVDLGQTVAASLQAPKLFVIANNLSEMQVETRIDEADIGQIHPGLPVSFTVDAFPDRTFDGRVAQVRLQPITDSGVVTYTTVIRTENPQLRLRPGMTANVAVLVASRDSVLTVPNAALRFRPADAALARGGESRAGADTASAGRLAGARVGAGARAGRGGAGAGAGVGAGGGSGARRGMREIGMRGSAGGTGPVDVDAAMTATAIDAVSAMKPGRVYLLRDGKPAAVRVMTGVTDGINTEVVSDELKEGDVVIIGTEQTSRTAAMTPPPGMGGPMGGPRPGGGGARSGR